MIAKCGACGAQMEVPEGLADGQHVVCPFCGEKTCYSKPTRIELPTGLARNGRRAEASASGPSSDQSVPKADSTLVERKPKIGIRRSENATVSNVDLNAQAILRKMQDEEESKQVADAKAAQARKRAFREDLVRKILIICVVGLVAAGGCIWFMKRAAARRAHAAIELERARMAEEAERQESAKRQAAREDAQKKLDASRMEAKKKADAERMKMLEEDKRKRAADEAAWNEKMRQREQRRVEIERYNTIMHSFENAILLPWGSLPKEKRPGAVEGVFTCLLPGANGRFEICEAESRPGGTGKVTLLTEDGNSREIAFTELEVKLDAFGGIVHNGSMTYVLPPKETAKPRPLPEGCLNPTKLRLAEIAEVVNRLGMSANRLAFEVRLNVPGGRNSILVQTLSFDRTMDSAALDEALAEIAGASVRKPTAPKPKRRTVMMYEGEVIKRQMNGVTLVPMSPTRVTEKWIQLRDEAERQEREANAGLSEEAMQKYREAVSQKVRKLRAASTLSIVIRDVLTTKR